MTYERILVVLFFAPLGYRSIGRTSDSGSDNQGSSPCSPANGLCPHRLAGPGQRPFTPSTGVQIPLGTPRKINALREIVGRFFVYGVLLWLYVKNRGKEFQGSHSDEVFLSLSAEDADTQAVVFKIPEAVRSSLDELHFPVEAFGNPVVLREAEHPGNLFLP